MLSNSTRHTSIISSAVLALLALCFIQPNAHAQWSPSVETITINFSLIEVEYGQTLRLNLTNVGDLTQSSQQPPTIRALARFRDEAGNVIYVSTAGGGVWKTTNGGQSCSFDVNRDRLPFTGDPRTGAVAVVPELLIEASLGARTHLPVALEITNNLTGKVEFHQGKYLTLRPRPADGSDEINIVLYAAPVSISRGETLRLNLTHLLPPPLADQGTSGDGVITFYDLNGTSHGTLEAALRPGHTLSFELDRDQLRLIGDPGTGRVLLRPEIHYRLRLDPALVARLVADGTLPQLPFSLELITNSTGKARYVAGHYAIEINGRVAGW